MIKVSWNLERCTGKLHKQVPVKWNYCRTTWKTDIALWRADVILYIHVCHYSSFVIIKSGQLLNPLHCNAAVSGCYNSTLREPVLSGWAKENSEAPTVSKDLIGCFWTHPSCCNQFAKWVNPPIIIAKLTVNPAYRRLLQLLGQKTVYVWNTKNLDPFITPGGHHGNSGNIQAAHEGY